MKFFLAEASGYSRDGYKESYMAAEENAYSELEEGLEEWLAENITNRYSIESEYMCDVSMVVISLFVVFQNEADAMAFKLRWT